MLDTDLLIQYAPLFGGGLLLTAGCSAAAAAIGVLFGIPLAMSLLAKNSAVSLPARVYVEV
ncbi:amino acid ABC transporter permease, partial [Mesorhizobium sp. M7A.F.Ca.US.011.01.1.1]